MSEQSEESPSADELQDQIKLAGVISPGVIGAGFEHIVDPFIRRAMQTAHKMIAAKATPAAINLETGGLAHQGLTGEAVGIVRPAGTPVPQVRELTGPRKLGEVFPDEEWLKRMPGVMDQTMVVPDPKLSTKAAAFTNDPSVGPEIRINPYLLRYPSEAARILKHEGSHASAALTSNEAFPQLRGAGLESIMDPSEFSGHMKQMDWARRIREGTPDPFTQDIKSVREVRQLAGLSEKEWQDAMLTANMIRKAGIKHPLKVYHNTYGEQLARWFENPNLAELAGVPHLSASWTGPRRAADRLQERWAQQFTKQPDSSVFGSDIWDFLYKTNVLRP